MTSTEVFLTGLAHLCRLVAIALLYYLAWEMRQRPSRWLYAALLLEGLALSLTEAILLGRLYSRAGGLAELQETGRFVHRALSSGFYACVLAWAVSLLGKSNQAASICAASVGITALPAAFLAKEWPAAFGTVAAGWLIVCAFLFAGPAARSQRDSIERQFFRYFGIACGLYAAALVFFQSQDYGEAIHAVSFLAIPLTLLVWIARRNVFGLTVSRRFLFVASMGLLSALYLFLVKRVSDQMFLDYGQSRSFMEILLIMAAAVLWLPLYEWMRRKMARRAELMADFSKKVIEQAAGKLDASEQVQFLANGLAQTLNCRRLLLLARGTTIRQGSAGVASPLLHIEASNLLTRIEKCWDEVITHHSAPPGMDEWLALHGFHYLLPLRHEMRIVGALLLDFSPRRYLADIDPMFPSIGREISLVLASASLAEEKLEMEKALAVQESRAVIGDLTATIVHEIKNPLSNIRALSQLIREDGDVREKYERDLTFIIEETDRLNSSVMQLLDYAAQPADMPAEVDIPALVERAARRIEVEAASSQLRVELDVESTLRLPWADARSMEQIVMNLLRNAAQASPVGARVMVTATQTEGQVRISIRDQGPGIPAEFREKIFQPYFTTKQSGTGLGLAIVMKNLRLLKGTLEVQSPLEGGRGSSFTVSLPVEGRASI